MSTTKNDKPLIWLGGEVKSPSFSAEVRQEVGYLLRALQQGESLSMPHSRPMASAIGAGCHELRVNDRDQTWRIVYWLDVDAVYVLDVFSKNTQTTPDEVKRRCRRRLRHLQQALGRQDDGRGKTKTT